MTLDPGKVADGEPKQVLAEPVAERSCDTCGGYGFLRQETPVGGPDFGKAIPCPTCGPERQQEAWLRRRAALPADLRDMTLDTMAAHPFLKPPEDLRDYAECRRAVMAYATGEDEHKWLLLGGPPGWGKTRLAMGILNWRTDHPDAGAQGIYVAVPDLMAELRATFKDDNGPTFEGTLETYRQAPLLVLDDVGSERQTDFAAESLYRLINHRYIHRMETVFTTNVCGDHIAERIADRVQDRRLTSIFALELPSFRSGEMRRWTCHDLHRGRR